MKKLTAAALIFILISAFPSAGEDHRSFFYQRAGLESKEEKWREAEERFVNSFDPGSQREKEYAAWLWRKTCFEDPDVSYLLRSLEEAEKRYIYEVSDGETESAGKPLLKGIAGLDEDRRSFRDHGKRELEKVYGKWMEKAEVKYDELEKKIPEGAVSEIRVCFEEYKNKIRDELESLFLASERRFLNMRLYDLSSLKKESVGNRGEGIAGQLLKEISSDRKKIEEELESKREGSFEEEFVEKISGDMEKAFKEGIKKWNNMETDFILKRIEWEKSLQKKYLEAETKWDDLFEEYRERGSKWSEDIERIIKEGEEKWKDRTEAFERSCCDELIGIQSALEKESGALAERISESFSVYETADKMGRKSEENRKYLEMEIERIEQYKADRKELAEKYGEELRKKRLEKEQKERKISELENSESDSKYFLHASEIKKLQNEIDMLKTDMRILEARKKEAEDQSKSRDTDLKNYIEELAFWKRAEERCSEERDAVKKELCAFEAEICGGGEIENERRRNELARLEERKNELHRSAETARKVYEYAKDKSSDRDTKAETLLKYEKAEKALQDAEERYAGSAETLRSFLNKLEENETVLEKKAQDLKIARSNLEEAEEGYAGALELYMADGISALEISMENKKRAIEDYYEDERVLYYREYYKKSEGYGSEKKKEIASGLAAGLKEEESAYSAGLKALEDIHIDFMAPDMDLLGKIGSGYGLEEAEEWDIFISSLKDEGKSISERERVFGNMKEYFENMIYGNRAALFFLELEEMEEDPEEYKNRKICEAEMIRSDPDLGEKERKKRIKEIELETEAAEIYSLYSPACDIYYRKKACEGFEKIFTAERDENGNIAGIRCADEIEDTEDVKLLFKKLLSEEELPDYLLFAAASFIEKECGEKGIEIAFEEEGDSEEEEEFLENMRMIFSGDRYSGNGDFADEKNKSIIKLFIAAYETFFNGAGETCSEESVREALRKAKSMDDGTEELKTKLDIQKREASALSAGRKNFYIERLLPLKENVERAGEEEKKLFSLYSEEAGCFEKKLKEYKRRREECEKLFAAYKKAEDDFREADELRTYALSPYQNEEDAERVFWERRRRALYADAVYNAAETAAGGKDMRGTPDLRYREIMEEKEKILDSILYAERVKEKAEEKSADHLLASSEAFKNMCDLIEDRMFLFHEGLGEKIKDIDSISGMSEGIGENYFGNEKQYGEDVFFWIKSMDSALLKEFGNAYYWRSLQEGNLETFRKIDVPIYSDQNFNKLSSYGYAFCHPEVYVERKAKEIYAGIKEDAEKYKLYLFFEEMMNAGRIKFDTSFIGKDISDIAHDYLWDVSLEKERNYKNNHKVIDFFKRRSKKMGKMRKAMADIDGTKEREEFSGYIGKIKIYEEKYFEGIRKAEETAGGYGETSYDGFMRKGAELTGSSPKSGTIKDIFEDLHGEDMRGFVSAVSKLCRSLYKKLDEKNAELDKRKAELCEELENKRLMYRSGTEKGDMTMSEAADLFNEIFCNASYTEEDDALFSLEKIKELDDYGSSSGGLKILNFAGLEIMKLHEAKSRIYKEKAEDGLLGGYEKIREESFAWQEKMREILRSGNEEWKKTYDSLNARRMEWEKGFAKEASEKEELWEKKYGLLDMNKEKWLKESARNAAEDIVCEAAKKTGLSCDILTAETESILIPPVKTKKLEEMMTENLDGKKLSELAGLAGYYTSLAGNRNSMVRISSLLPEAAKFKKWEGDNRGEELYEEIRQRASYLAALKMKGAVEETGRKIAGNIEEENRKAAKAVNDTLEGKGYRKKGNIYSRKAIIDETLLGGIEEEEQVIEGYRRFEAPGFDIGADLSMENLKRLTGGMIELLIEKASENLKRYAELIFGGADGKEKWKGFDKNFMEYAERAGSKFANSEQYDRYKKREGLFYMHVGYIPVMDDDHPEKVRREGYGEYGRIYKLFFINEGRLGRGLSAIDVPFYLQKLWDDDKDNDGKSDSFFAAPTIRQGGQIVAALLKTLDPCFGMIAALADSALFASLDMGFGGRSFWGAGMDIFRTAANAAINAGRTSAVGILTETARDTIKNAFLKTAACAAAETAGNYVANTAASFVDSLEIGRDGISIDNFGDLYKENVSWRKNYSDYISKGIAAGTGGAAYAALEGKMEKSDLPAMADILGSLAGTGYELGVSGNAAVNILNLSDLTKGKFDGGLLEMEIGKKKGFLHFGTEGYDLSLSSIKGAAGAIKDYIKRERLKKRYEEIVSALSKAAAMEAERERRERELLSRMEKEMKNESPIPVPEKKEYRPEKKEWRYDSENSIGKNEIFIIKDKKGNDIELNAIGEGNPVLKYLLSQHDSSLKDIPMISKEGCNFMVILGAAQMITGKLLSPDEIKNIWNSAVEKKVLLKKGLVFDSKKLGILTLEALGVENIMIELEDKRPPGSFLAGYRIQVPYKGDNEKHYILGDIYKRKIYNPGNTNTIADNWKGVYVYAR